MSAVAGSGVLDALRAALPPAGLLADAAQMAPFVEEWRGHVHGRALAVALPGSAAETAAVVRACAAHDVAIVPQGGNTGLCIGATPVTGARRAVVVGLARMRRVRALDVAANAIVVDAGCTLASIHEAARAAERLFPLSMGSEGTAQIGGAISTNAGGTAVLRYGNMRELVLGLEVVLPDGQIWDGLRKLRKDNTGYDLKHLFIGAEGTLGVVTGAVLKLFPRPREQAHAWIGVRTPEVAVALLGFMQARFDAGLTAFELLSRGQVDLVPRFIPDTRNPLDGAHPWHVLVEVSEAQAGTGLAERLIDALADAAEAGLVDDAVPAQSEAQAAGFWRLRHGLSDANKAHGVSVTLDVGVPISEAPRFIGEADALVAARFPGAEVLVVAHLGDGNVHYIVQYEHERWGALADPAATRDAILAGVNEVARGCGGTFSAEHGVGRKFTAELARHKSPLELAMMRLVKQALDPRGLMNPGNLLPG